MIENVLRYLNNYFAYDEIIAQSVTATGFVSSGAEMIIPGQYVWIAGTRLNDGVYKVTAVDGDAVTVDGGMQAENTGEFIATGLSIPKAVVDIAEEVETYNTANPGGVTSESLGDYSVTYGGAGGSWQKVFGAKLAPWRRVYMETRRG